MKLFSKNLMLAILMLASVNMFAQKGDTGELEKKFQAMNNKMAEAMVNDDYATIMSFYDAEVISMPNYGPVIKGIVELKEKQKEAHAKGNKVTAMSFSTKQVSDYGDVLVEIGTYNITMEIVGMPDPVSDKGKYLTVWKKYDDGIKILNEIWNTDVNPMTFSTPKGDQKPSPVNDQKGNKPQEEGKPKSGKSLKSEKKN